MKQILQDLVQGGTSIVDAPTPQATPGNLLIHTTMSLISAGTERMLVDFGKASYLEKARQQPEKVKMVLEKVKTDGLIATVSAVRSKLAQPLPLGYCNVGVVADIGVGVTGFSMGDRVVSNAPHGDVVSAVQNLCARIPDSVDDESAAFTVVASIALQGIRLAAPSLGEFVTVIGVGLIGLLTVQLLRAHGCHVLAIDFDEAKLALAKQFGAEICNLAADHDPLVAGHAFSRGRGVDAVIITASTKSNDPVTQAAKMARKRAKIVLVGVTGLELNRSDFYEKELTFQVSCSYGPGRYDLKYEKQGCDYPIGFVRWTAQRNFEACLDLMATNQLNVLPLITHSYLFEEAPAAYLALTEEKKVLGILLRYTSTVAERNIKEVIFKPQQKGNASVPILGFIGAGNYASRVLIPAFKQAGALCHTIVTAGGMSGVIHGKKAGFIRASTDIDALLSDDNINTIVIATRHDTHASFVVKALNAQKNVFVEKPLALTLEQLSEVESAYYISEMSGKKPCLMVGFNRRFSPHVQKIKQLLQGVAVPKLFIMTINAGAIPEEHWTQDQVMGGGRIIGEACHFIDLMRYLANCAIVSVQVSELSDSSKTMNLHDNASISLHFADGSSGTIHYFSNGALSFPKERIEVFVAGQILQLDNFRQLNGFGWPNFKKMTLWRQDKGQAACAKAFTQAVMKGFSSPIAISELIEVAKISIEADQLLRK